MSLADCSHVRLVGMSPNGRRLIDKVRLPSLRPSDTSSQTEVSGSCEYGDSMESILSEA